MELTCQQCSTVFTIDMTPAPGQAIEVVCPGCFQLHKVVGPPARPASVAPPPESPGRSEGAKSPLGDGGVADRLRAGFTLGLEVRHASWSEPRRLNPFEIERLIYEGQLDGTEEFRENAGRWFSIGEHPDFALVFQLVGRPVVKPVGKGDGSQPRFSGWRSMPTPVATPALPASGPFPAAVSSPAIPAAPVLSASPAVSAAPVAAPPSIPMSASSAAGEAAPIPERSPVPDERSSPSSRRWLPLVLVILVLAAVAIGLALRSGG